MKIKQQRLLCTKLTLEANEVLEKQIDKYKPLLQKSVIMLDGCDDDTYAYLKTQGFCLLDGACSQLQEQATSAAMSYVEKAVSDALHNENNHVSQSEALTTGQNVDELLDKTLDEPSVTQHETTLIDETVRSGALLHLSGDALILSRVNSGATIHVAGAVSAYGIIDGEIRADGAFVLFKQIGNGRVFLHDLLIDTAQCFENMTLVTHDDGALQYKELM